MSEFSQSAFEAAYLACGEIPAAFRTEEIARRCAVIAAKLLEDNARFNLTAITAPDEILHKHILDSLIGAEAIASLAPDGGRMLDVGSGAGFPSLPAAAALPQMRVTALDSTAKKIVHIRETAAAAGIEGFSAIAGRAEEIARDGAHRAQYRIVTARAVANLPVLAELCLPFAAVGGYFLAMKGKNAPQEIAAAASAISRLGGGRPEMRQYAVPGDDAPRYLVIIRKERPTPGAYPRAYAQIAKKPL